MKETTRIITARITYIGTDLAEKEEGKQRFIENVKGLLDADDVMVDKIQDFIMDKDEPEQKTEIRFSLNDVERIIEGKKRRLDDLEGCWNDFTRHMECGEIRELKQSCIDDEIIIACLEKFLHPAPWKDAMMQHFVKGD